MNYTQKEITLKDGSVCTLRCPEIKDAAALIELLKVTSAETPFLLREPEEITLTVEEEKAFLAARADDKGTLMLLSEDEEGITGLCSLTPAGPHLRVAHRSTVAISLISRAWGKGLGTAMLRELLSFAKEYGYKQAELEVVEGNDTAIALYKKLGFVPYGTRPNTMKYKDGSFRNEILMYKELI